MDGLTTVTIDFETSHLIFPRLIGIVLVVLGLTIVVTRRREIAGAGVYWRKVLGDMDKVRFFGTLILTVIYFSLMVPIGDIWPNTGMGFLLCSIPLVFLTGLLYMHVRSFREIAIMAAVAVIAPALVWWLFADVFALTLP